MSDRIKEWDEYFGIHCHLPAAAIRDLFDEIERLQKIQAGLHKECDTFAGECERLREALHDSMEAAIRRDTRLRAALQWFIDNDLDHAQVAEKALQEGE